MSSPRKEPPRARHQKAMFSPEDDKKLFELASQKKEKNWTWISQKMGEKTARQCRERWQHYLDPSIFQGEWTSEEDLLLCEKYKEIGPSWTALGKICKGRSPNSVRNRWLMLNRHKQRGPEMHEDSKETEQNEAEESAKKPQASGQVIPEITFDSLFKEPETVANFFEIGKEDADFLYAYIK